MVALHGEDTVVLPKTDFFGSKLRFLMLTASPKEQVTKTLNDLVSPWASIDLSHDHWMPNGFLDSTEAKLGECEQFLTADNRGKLTQWWLAKVTKRTNTPNWDLVSTCTAKGQPGLILIEGKAHTGELDEDGKKPGNRDNHEQIGRAIEEATQGLNKTTPGWNLCRDSHYQLCNRFAWAWKVATLGVPTILIYLGFLNATEMEHRGEPLTSPEGWSKVIRDHSANTVPPAAWENRLQTSGAPMWALIRSLDQQWLVGR